MDRTVSRKLSEDYLAVLRNRATTFEQRYDTGAQLLWLRFGFWQEPDELAEQTFMAFLLKLSGAMIGGTLRGRRQSILEPQECANELWLEFVKCAPRIRDDARGWLVSAAFRVVSRLANGRVSLHCHEIGEREPRRGSVLRPHAGSDKDRRRVLLRTKLRTLRGLEGRAVRRRIMRGLSYPQIALELGITPVAARKHVSRGMIKLRARLDTLPSLPAS